MTTKDPYAYEPPTEENIQERTEHWLQETLRSAHAGWQLRPQAMHARRCVKAHPMLLAACRAALDACDNEPQVSALAKQLDAAIRAAEGEGGAT